MRKFALTYSVPGTCDCCGAALPVAPGGASAGTYTMEMPEGDAPTSVAIGQAVRLTLGGGQLEVRLRQKRGSNRQWSLQPLYNSGAFTRPRSHTEHPEGDAEFYWYVFSFELPEFRPGFSTWWAELKFSETPWGAKGGHLPEAHNSARLSVRLTTLE